MKLAGVFDQVLRFAGIGVLASGLYFALATGLSSFAGLAAVPASVLAYGVSAVFSYNGHRQITFRGGDVAPADKVRFVMTTAFGLLLALFIPHVLAGYAPVVSFTAVLLIVPLCSFLLLKFFVFRA